MTDTAFMNQIDRCSNCLSLVAVEICPHYGRPSPDIWATAAVDAAKAGDFEYALTLLRAARRFDAIIAGETNVAA